MTEEMKAIENIYKSLYGEKQRDKLATKVYKGKVYVGWYILGYSSFEELNLKYPSPYDIKELYELGMDY